ncbi:MAG TPA: RNA methyltransferase [Candidatus Acidoferrales bacterium]|nr:RNA methyltransferase [Candidatus Acidoferrales bacterium]
MDLITSRENRWAKAFRSALQGTGPGEGEFIGVEGPKTVAEALRAGIEAEALLLSESSAPEMETMAREAGLPNTRVLRTTDRLFATISATDAPQGVAALCRQPKWQFEDVMRGRPDRDGLLAGEAPLVVVLAGIQDPGNVGTIVRSAEAFGATGAVAVRGSADPWSPKAVRASAGSALRLPVLRGIPAPVLLAQLRMARIAIVATSARPNRAERGRKVVLEGGAGPLAIWIGGEGAGLPAGIEREADAVIAVPMAEAVESLNAGVAASVVLYEIARERRLAGRQPGNLRGTVSSH